MKVAQSCLILCYPLNSSLPGSSVHGILQARILEWLAVPFSRGNSQSRNGTQLSCIIGGFFVEKAWLPTTVLLPGKSHGRRSLVGCSPWGLSESDRTERLHFHFSLSCIGEGNDNPLQCSCLENPRDGGAWWAAVYGVSRSRTWLKRLSSSSSFTIWTTREANNNLRSLIFYHVQNQSSNILASRTLHTQKQTCWLQRYLVYLVGYLRYVVSVVKIKIEKMLK